METEEKRQADEAVEETKQEEAPITEAETAEQVKALLGNEQSPEEVVETEVKEDEPVQETKTQEPTEVEANVPVITDDLINQYPALRSYRGKPLAEVAPVYQKLVAKMTKDAERIKELERKLEQTTLKELGEPPDPVDHRAEFDEWLKRRDELVKSQVKVEPEPQINYMAEVQKKLPNVDINKLADEWAKYNSRRLFDEVGVLKPQIQKMYQDDPDLLIDEMVSFYNLASRANQNEFMIEKKAKEEAFVKTKEAFKQARKTQKESSQVNVVSRTNELTPEDEILQKIYQSSLSG